MPDKSDNPLNFWQELKRRKVVRVIIGYLASAYVLLELTSIVAEPWGLPDWTINLVSILLVVGFFVTVIISWIFDVTPEGIKKTGTAKTIRKKEQDVKTSKRKLRASDVVIAILFAAVLVLAYPRIFKKDKFHNLREHDGKITIAVLPFSNQTGDTTLNWFSTGIASLLINGLGNSQGLAVRDDYTMSEAIKSETRINTADLTPSMAKSIAGKANAQTYITGSFQGHTERFVILINLVNTETGNVLWTNKIEGNLNSSEYLSMADSLCGNIRNYLEIKALEQVADFDFRDVYPQSAEAYRYFIEGMDLVLNLNYETGIQSLEKAIEIDSSFAFASFFLAYTCNLTGKWDIQNLWIKRALANADRIPARYRPWLEMWNSCSFGKSYQDILKYCDQLAVSGIDTRFLWNDLGITYFDFLQQYPKAVSAFENVIKLNDKLGKDWKFILFFEYFIRALHITGDHEREKEIAHMVLEVLPDQANYCYYYMTICALSRGDTAEANQFFRNYLAVHKEKKTADYHLERWIGDMYKDAGIPDQAEKHYRKALELNPGYYSNLRALAAFLINENRNVDEGIAICQGLREEYPADNFYNRVLSDEGWGYYQKGNFNKALECLSKAWEMEEGFNIIIYNRLEAAKKAVTKQKSDQ